jgi:invasion protein IalB
MMTTNRLTSYFPFSIAGKAAALALSLPYFIIPALAQQGAQGRAAASDKLPAAMDSRGQRKAIREIKYGGWQKVCFKTPGTNMVCRTMISGSWDTGQSAVRVDLVERESESTARLQLFLPVGLYLPAGVKVTVDQGKPYQLPYVWCMTNTCIAASVAEPQLIQDMQKGEKLGIEIVDHSVQSVSTELPLKQFDAVRKGAPAQTLQQDIDE